jgi:hypothetical protein
MRIMSATDSIRSLLAGVLSEVEADPAHRMSPLRRREVYGALGTLGGQPAIGRLAVIAAQRVLPIFQQSYPDDTLPQALLDTAVGILQAQVDAAQARAMIDAGYHASGGAWGYDEREVPWPVWLAANTCYHALKEAGGYQPLSFLPEYYKGDVLTPWSDEDLCAMDFSDAAGAAAIASSSDLHGTAYDSQKLLAFWKWWLGEAIPAALAAQW